MRKRTPESGVLKACLDLLAVHKIWHCRMNTGAVKDGIRFFRFGKKGMADILAVPRLSLEHNANPFANVSGTAWFATPLWIEAKADRGKQTEDQIAFEKEVSMAGHHYLVVRDVNTLSAWLKEHGCI